MKYLYRFLCVLVLAGTFYFRAIAKRIQRERAPVYTRRQLDGPCDCRPELKEHIYSITPFLDIKHPDAALFKQQSRRNINNKKQCLINSFYTPVNSNKFILPRVYFLATTEIHNNKIIVTRYKELRRTASK